RFPRQPELMTLVTSAEKRLAQQRREARISAVREQAGNSAAQGHFHDALKVLRDAIAEVGDEASLSALYDRIQRQLEEQARKRAVAAIAVSVQATIANGNYEAAVKGARAGLQNFPGESRLKELLETAERSLAEQQRAQKIARIKEQALTLASTQQFTP